MPRRVTLDGTDESIPHMEDRHCLKKTPHSQQTPATTTPIPIQSPPYSPPTDWKREYCILRQAYLKQERRLEALQEEHFALKKQIQKVMSGGKHVVETNNSMMTLNATTRKTPLLYKNSPGTRFVAELSEVMELEVGQHVLLSSIMDRHFVEIKKL